MILGYHEKDNKFIIGSKVLYECESNFEAHGTAMLECQNDGYWSEYPPKCLPKGLFGFCVVVTDTQSYLLQLNYKISLQELGST